MPTLLLADDHDLVRDTIAAYLEAVEDFKIIAVPDLDAALVQMAGPEAIDLVILDYNMPGMNGLDGLDRVCRAFPKIKVALMSGVASRDVAQNAMERGACGFIPKSLSAVSMVNAIRFVLSGERYIPFDFNASAPAVQATGDFAKLTGREMQALEQLCNGLSNKEIARHLKIQEVTVKLHIKNMFAKLGVSNRTQAALLAKEQHLF